MSSPQPIINAADGTSWVREDRSCPGCGSSHRRLVGRRGGDAHREGKGVAAAVVACEDCELLYCSPALIPQGNPYDRYVADEYFQAHDFEARVENGRAVAEYAEKILGGPGRVLELGCGRGEFLLGAISRGWTAFGIEMTENFAETARSRNISVDNSPISESKLLDDQYDLIILEAILEHLYEPVEALERAFKALRSGGLLFIEVPNESSLSIRAGNLYMRLRRRDWVINLSPTFPPFHVIGFSPSALVRMLERIGFRIQAMRTPKWPNELGGKGSLVAKAERAAFGIVQTCGAMVGRGDGIICWAQKP